MAATKINPTGELPEPLPIPEATSALGQLDGYTPTETDRTDYHRQWGQPKALFLIDRAGIVRWTNIVRRGRFGRAR